MDFELSEDLRMIQRLAHDFVVDQLKPLERDLLGRSADLGDARAWIASETEKELIGKAVQTGLWGASVPEELGGAGLGTLANCLIEEELSQTVVPFTFGDVTPILFDCSQAQRQEFFVPAFNREKLPYLALMEPERRRELLVMKTTAQKQDGRYIIDGVKTVMGRPAEDYFAVVFAIVDQCKSPTCFLIDGETAGFDVQVITGHDSSSAKIPMLLKFRNCSVPEGNRLGEEGNAFSLGKRWLPSRRIVRGARSMGVAQRLLEEAALRALSWQSFGRPVSERTSVQAALAEIATSIHACRLLVYEAAWKADKGEDVQREASMAKLCATQMVHSVADRVAHIYGGPPYIEGLAMERLCQNTLATNAIELAMELQSNIIARDILKGLKV